MYKRVQGYALFTKYKALLNKFYVKLIVILATQEQRFLKGEKV